MVLLLLNICVKRYSRRFRHVITGRRYVLLLLCVCSRGTARNVLLLRLMCRMCWLLISTLLTLLWMVRRFLLVMVVVVLLSNKVEVVLAWQVMYIR